jgi:hypothetical protein
MPHINIPAIVVTLATFIGLQGMSLVLRPKAGGAITDYISDVTQLGMLGIPAGFAVIMIIVAWFEFGLFRSAFGSQPPHFTGFCAVGIICGNWRADFSGPGWHRLACYRY